jgi:hypothetical protein
MNLIPLVIPLLRGPYQHPDPTPTAKPGAICEAITGKGHRCRNVGVWYYRLRKRKCCTKMEVLCGTHYRHRVHHGWTLERTGRQLA